MVQRRPAGGDGRLVRTAATGEAPQRHALNAGADPERFLVSIDEIERRTGLDFLPELDGCAQTALEAKRAQAVW